MTSSVRLDKWLQVARVFKTRSQATRACNLSRVKVNGQTAKAHLPQVFGHSLNGVAGPDQQCPVLPQVGKDLLRHGHRGVSHRNRIAADVGIGADLLRDGERVVK